jgi:Sigma-70, region 4
MSRREAISLAFITALQLLPPRQRAALILRDVLDFSTREVAETLNTTEDSVASALKRARTTLSHELPSADQPPPLPDSPAERAALDRLVQAFEASDADALAALMTDDVWVKMPPVPYEYQGGRTRGTSSRRRPTGTAGATGWFRLRGPTGSPPSVSTCSIR